MKRTIFQSFLLQIFFPLKSDGHKKSCIIFSISSAYQNIKTYIFNINLLFLIPGIFNNLNLYFILS